MKRSISVLLTLSLLLACCVTLISCVHNCTFSEKWSSNATSHWHKCAIGSCEQVRDMGEHEWDDGKVTVEPTQDKDGELTLTCKVCSVVKHTALAYSGFTEDEWDAALDDGMFVNFTYTEKAETSGNGVDIETVAIYKIAENSAWARMSTGEESESVDLEGKESVDALREQIVESVRDILDYDSFEYDRDTKSYKAKEPIHISALSVSTSDVVVKFDGERITEISYTISLNQNGISFSATSCATFTDYGTTDPKSNG